MRPSLVLLLVVSAPAYAQSTGVWTGYVRGWVDERPRQRVVPSWNLWAAAPWVVASSAALEEAQRTRALAAQELLALEQVKLAQQQQRLLVQQQQQAAQQQAEASQVAQQARDIEQRRAYDAERVRLAALQHQEVQQLAEENRQREQRMREEENSRIAAERALAEKSKGNSTIYRWVDADGVTHLSTSPRGSR